MASNFQELCSPLLGSLDGEVFSFMVVPRLRPPGACFPLSSFLCGFPSRFSLLSSLENPMEGSHREGKREKGNAARRGKCKAETDESIIKPRKTRPAHFPDLLRLYRFSQPLPFVLYLMATERKPVKTRHKSLDIMFFINGFAVFCKRQRAASRLPTNKKTCPAWTREFLLPLGGTDARLLPTKGLEIQEEDSCI